MSGHTKNIFSNTRMIVPLRRISLDLLTLAYDRILFNNTVLKFYTFESCIHSIL